MACDSPYYVRRAKWDETMVPVPCGRCPPCKFRRVNEWVFRLTEHEKHSTSSYFVTLTYDTSSVPISPNGFMTLRRKDFQDYMKRLRKLCPGAVVKYYAVGEYGSQTMRPHYHAIVFGVPDTSMFYDAWHLNGVPLGTIHIGQVTGRSIAYTLKYIDKPHYVRRHSRDDRSKEFSLSSKNLGLSYINDASTQYHKQHLGDMYVVKLDGHRVPMPRYYRNKIFSEAERSAQVDIVRKSLEQRSQYDRLHHRVFGFSYDEYLEHQKFYRFTKFYSSSSQQRNTI